MTESGLNTGYDSLGRYPFRCYGMFQSVSVAEFLFRLEGEKKYSSPSCCLLCVVFCLWRVVVESVSVRSLCGTVESFCLLVC